MTESMLTTPMISAPTADGYQQAHRVLVERAQAFLDDEDGDSREMYRHARQLDKEIREHNAQPRLKLTRTAVHRNALKRTIDAIYEFADLEHHDGQLVSSWKIWEEFQRAIRSGAHSADSYGPGDTTWAPEDDTNPLKTTPIPVPDPSAAPVVEGILQGDWVKPTYKSDDGPRQVLTGVREDGPLGPAVRLSDPRDGTFFGGYWVQAPMLAKDYVRVDQPDTASVEGGAEASEA